MKRIRNLFRQFEFHIFLFALFFFLFNWPFLGIFHAERGEGIFIYLISVWAVAITMLYLIGKCCGGSLPEENGARQGDDK
jgi:hypothetical protein